MPLGIGRWPLPIALASVLPEPGGTVEGWRTRPGTRPPGRAQVCYNKIYKKVAPLMAKVKEATETKEAAEASLAIVMARLKEVKDKACAAEDVQREDDMG